MQLTEEQRCLLWLSQAEISADRIRRLMADRGSATALRADYDAGVKLTSRREAAGALSRFRSDVALDALCERMNRMGVSLLFQDDPAYPSLLSSIDDPPYVLYAMGDVSVLGHPAVGMVGTRYPSGYGRNMARVIADGLARAGIAVVSGMARGIDGCAHEGALDAGGETVAVLGSGINVPYPPEHAGLYRRIAAGPGAVISEYPPDAAPQAYHFPNRNRVISGLCHGVVFVEGKVKSGGMITVTAALNQGREVFAVPGCVGQSGAEGPHTILREGARLVTSAEDILEDLGVCAAAPAPEHEEALPTEEKPETRAILRALSKEALGMDALCACTGYAPDALLAELGVLEIMGRVRRDSGNIFALAIRTAPTE